ncbi:MAG: hypothetical protein COC19_04175 [SAR86 cluster bacterium]|uniref:Hemin uptake protein HemP n=1 Tax=SAR86 cluster bacterium TaxID=2030880 RepID=A0A2A4MPL9_9GAMM|nr:MAG: hypothetical protein COC19_04175 [SAR86 cluster bacterium]
MPDAITNGIEKTSPKVGSIASADLLGCAKQLRILHNGEAYTLRITANNKLILTK